MLAIVKMLKTPAIFVLVRLACGLLLSIDQRFHPETAMAIIMDLPTVALAFLSSHLFGWPDCLCHANDPAFWILGVISWFLVGLGWSLLFRSSARAARSQASSRSAQPAAENPGQQASPRTLQDH
jgi:hypothetical protein